MAVTASFLIDTLSVLGDNNDNTIEASRNAAGAILVNGGAVAVQGGTPTVANTALIQVFGLGQNDTISLNETSGALPAANLFGGAGNDTLIGGSGGDQLFGQADNDTLLGKGGFDFLFGGDGNDTLTGGDADDQVFGEAGNDRMIWNPGDDTDLFEGGADEDTAEVNAGNGDETFTLTANGTRVRFDRLNPAPFSLDIGTTEHLVVNMNGGNDSFSATGNLASLIDVTVDGGTGNDTILGSNGNDTLLGGDGDDFIDGQQGNDTVFLGAGDDVAQWDPGDGSDTIEGQDGADTLLFNGSNGDEIFEVSANGGRVRLTRNLGNIVMDLDGVERIDLNAQGGVDTVKVNDLSGTDLAEINVDLQGSGGGGDAQADTVIVGGTQGNDIIDIVGAGTSLSVIGLPARVNVTGAEGANDSLVINGLGGDDAITATTLPAGVVKLTIDGGAGNDTILGSQGADVLIGGDGDDFLLGDNGNDLALMGAGDDVFQWNPGDGSDTVEGQDGTDTMLFFGANIAEKIDILANGGRVLFTRDVAAITMDLDDVERIDFRALGGADDIVVGDLSGTDVTLVSLDLRGPNGGGDGAADTISVNATQGDDVFGVAGDAAGINVFGLQASVNIFFPEAANDRLILNGQGGDDVINASALEAGAVQLTINGGLGDDIIIGSEGDDLINGGDGDDTALMGAGNDTFVWNPGDDNDTLEGQAGTDTMLFNGANISEKIDIAVNNGRVLFTRDVANVVMDLKDVERITFNALGGSDTITVNDLSGTDVKEIDINLAGALTGPAGDGQPDTVVIAGTSGNDTISLSIDADGRLVVNGLATQIVIAGFDAGDTIKINGLAGDDVIDASGLGAIAAKLIFDGGDGNDILVGGAGADEFAGGAGDDVLIGNAGQDVLDGGPGGNILLQDGPAGPAGGVVALFGTANPDNTTIGRNAAGAILADGVVVPGATVANTGVIQLFGKDGDDVLKLDESSGALPRADLFGGAGNDVATGGSGNDAIFGGAGNDTLLGKGGFDVLFGGDGNDVLTGGDADDMMFGEAGDDRAIWNPGDDTDLFEGGTGTDTAEVNGGNGAEQFTATANGTRVRFDRVTPAPFSLDLGTTENLVVNMNGGDDSFSATGNLVLIKLTVDGGTGNDTIVGGNGEDLLLGGDGMDTFTGGAGNDVIDGGADSDTAIFSGPRAQYSVVLLANGDTQVTDLRTGAPDGVDILRNVETLVFAADQSVNHAPQIVSDGGGDTATVSIPENATAVTTVVATDIDPGATLTFDIVGGADAQRLVIDAATGALSFVTAPDFEAPTDQGSDNSYVVQVRASDGSLSDLQTITVQVTGVDEQVNQQPQIVSDGGGDTAILFRPENGTAVTTVVATDADPGTTLGYAIAGGTDAQRFVIDAATGALSFVTAPDFEAPTDQGRDNSYVVQVRASDGSLSDLQTITVKVTDVSGSIVGDDGDNVLVGTGENDLIKGLGGNDTAVFNVDFDTVKVVFEGTRIFIESAEGRDEVSGIENFQFTDGVIHLDDGNPLVNDLFYFANNKDVWDAGIDAEAHYNGFGWLEGRDPSALFSTKGYLSANADVRAAGINPLIHFDQFGWKEGRDPSVGFDIEQYLGHNPDLKAFAVPAAGPIPDKGPLPVPEQPPAGVNPLAHFEQFGRDEGRQIFATIGKTINNGFDAEFYLLANPDVGFAGVDPFQHYSIFGFKEGRDPNAFFDTKGYLAAYADVAAAGIDPLQHYMTFGFKEGRDPSGDFDTNAYLAANPDVAAAGINPFEHFLRFGALEGRSPHGDGIFA